MKYSIKKSYALGLSTFLLLSMSACASNSPTVGVQVNVQENISQEGSNPDVSVTEEDNNIVIDVSLYRAMYEGLDEIAVSHSEGVVSGVESFAYSLTGIPIPEEHQKTIPLAIDEGITEIGTGAFLNNTYLSSVAFPSSLEKIGTNAFKGTVFKELLLDERLENLEVLEEYAFANSGLHSVQIHTPSLRFIDRLAFSSCENLIEFYATEGLTVIEERAFENCSNLQEVSLPNSVELIGSFAFQNAPNVGTNGFSFPESLTFLGNGVFKGTNLNGYITLPSKLSSIGAAVFDGCDGITGITFPATITSWGQNILQGLPNLEVAIFSEGLTSIDAYKIFSNCWSSLRYVEIPSTVTSIDYRLFDTVGYTEDSPLQIVCKSPHLTIDDFQDVIKNHVVFQIE